MNKSELERHKMWEHPVPVSPFEERLAQANKGVNPEDLHKLTTNVMAGSHGNDITIGGQRRKTPFRPCRI